MDETIVAVLTSLVAGILVPVIASIVARKKVKRFRKIGNLVGSAEIRMLASGNLSVKEYSENESNDVNVHTEDELINLLHKRESVLRIGDWVALGVNKEDLPIKALRLTNEQWAELSNLNDRAEVERKIDQISASQH